MVLFSCGNFLTLPMHYFHYFLFSNEICLFYFYCDHRICRTHVVPITLLHVVHHVGCSSVHFPHYSCTQCGELKQFNICTFLCEYKKMHTNPFCFLVLVEVTQRLLHRTSRLCAILGLACAYAMKFHKADPQFTQCFEHDIRLVYCINSLLLLFSFFVPSPLV